MFKLFQQVASVVAGGMHTLALSVDGVVYSFGCNDEGALGRPIEARLVTFEF